MSRKTIALLGLEEDTAPVTTDASIETEIESNLQEVSTQQEQVGELTEAVTDTTEVVETLDSMAAAPDKAVEIATEYLMSRVAMKGTSLEAYCGKRDAFKDMLSGKFKIAQEGIMSRLGNTFKLIFTSEEKIQEQLENNVATLKKMGAITTVIVEPGWGRSFAQVNKPQLNGDDVLKLVKEYRKIVDSAELSTILMDYTKICNKMQNELSKSRYVADDAATAEINSLSEAVSAMSEKAIDIVAGDIKTAKNDPNFEPLNESQAAKISSEALAIITNKKFDQIVNNLIEALDNVNIQMFDESYWRLAGTAAKDIRAAQAIARQMNKSLGEVGTIAIRKTRLAFACARYIKASTAK